MNTRKRSRPNESSPEERALWAEVRASTQARRDAERAIAAEPLPENCPDLWLMDTPMLLNELSRIKGLAMAVPLKALSGDLPLQTVVDALWSLETRLRDFLRINADRQASWAKRARTTNGAAQPQMPPAGAQAAQAVFGGNSSTTR